MAKATPPPVDAQEYGDKTQEAQNAEALAATAAMEAETTPNVQPVEAQAAPQQPEAPPQAAAPASRQAGLQPRNLMQIIPPSLMFREDKGRLPSQQDYDVGQLWRALEQDRNTDPLVRAIAKKLLREE